MSKITITMPKEKYDELLTKVESAKALWKKVQKDEDVIFNDGFWMHPSSDTKGLVAKSMRKKYSKEHEDNLRKSIQEFYKDGITNLKSQVDKKEEDINFLKSEIERFNKLSFWQRLNPKNHI